MVFQHFQKARELGTFKNIPANTKNPSNLSDTDPFPIEETYKNQYDSSHFNSYYAQIKKAGSLESFNFEFLITQKLPEEKNFENYDISEILKLSRRTQEVSEWMKTPEVDQEELVFPEQEIFEDEIQVRSLSLEQINHYLKRTVFQRKEAWDTSVSQNSIYPIGSSFSVKDSEREPSDETLQEFLREASVVTHFRDLYSSSRDNITFPQDSIFLGEYEVPSSTEQSVAKYLEMSDFDWGFMEGKKDTIASGKTFVPGRYPFERTHIHGIHAYFDGEILYQKPYRNIEDEQVITFDESEWMEKERSYNIDISFIEKYRGDQEYQQKTYVFPDAQNYAGSF